MEVLVFHRPLVPWTALETQRTLSFIYFFICPERGQMKIIQQHSCRKQFQAEISGGQLRIIVPVRAEVFSFPDSQRKAK